MERLGKTALKRRNDSSVKLKTYSRDQNLTVEDRYKEFLEFLPNQTRVPCAIMKIGIVAGSIKAVSPLHDSIETRDIQVLRNQKRIEDTPTANLTPRMLSEFRRYMSRLHKNNNLNKSDRYCIGSIINISNLGAYPKNAGDFSLASSDEGRYQGIRLESVDKYDLTTSQENTNDRLVSPSSGKGIRERKREVQDDIELDKI